MQNLKISAIARTICAVLVCLSHTKTLAEPNITESSLDEIVVSAFRPVAVREMGTSLAVLQESLISSPTVEHFENLIQFVPNMNSSGEGSRARYFQIRGVGELEQYEGAPNPSVGFIVDDVDISGIGGVASTFDLDRVEVLRGPQSARFGSSALAGVVYAQSAMPDQDFSGRSELTIGSDDTTAIGVAVGGGITEQLTGRGSLYQYRNNGFRDNTFLGRDDTNERDELTFRGKLQYNFVSDWQALASVLYADFDNGYDAFALDNGPTTFSNEPGEDSQKTKAVSLRLNGSVNEFMTFESISSIAETDILFSFDGDWVNEEFWLPIVSDYRYVNPRQRDSLSQEFRFKSKPSGRLFADSTDWVFGAYWQKLDEDNVIDSTGEYIETAVGCEPGFCVTDRQIASNFSSDKVAIFGVIDSELSEQWSLSLGLRVERWRATYSDSWLDGALLTGPVSTSNFFAPSDTLVGGHVALNFDWNEDLRMYGRIARGFKAGGFNPSLAALVDLPNAPDAALISFQPEYLWNYELGLKFSALDGRLVGDISVFHMQRDDAQLSQSLQVDPIDPNSFVFVTANSDAEVAGLESQIEWQLSDNLSLTGAVGLMDSDWPLIPGVADRDLAHAPDYSVSLGLTWQGGDGWFARADVVASDSFYFDVSHNEQADAYELVNLALGKTAKNWTFTLWGRNVFDEFYQTRGFFFGNEPPAFAPELYTKFGDPRQIGLTLDYEF